MKKIFFSLSLIGCVGFAFGQQQTFLIKHISIENVYLDGGRDRGLMMHDTLEVRRNDRVQAELVVSYLADHSASCQILSKTSDLAPGDVAIRLSRGVSTPQTTEPPRGSEMKKPLTAARQPALPRRRKALQGSISFQAYHWDDQSASNFDFTQPTMQLNLRANQLGGRHLNLNIRTRGRYDKRARSLSNQVPQNEWRNRIYQFYLDYDNPDALLNFKIGRIITNPLSGVGYVDGLMTQFNVSPAVSTGLLAGTQPEWQYSDLQTSIQKYAAFTSYQTGDRQIKHYESTLAFTGEYHGSVVSREYLYWRNQFSWQRFLHIYQSAEVDLNTGWRKERTGQSISLSNFYYDLLLDAKSWVSVGLSIDERKNYWTYEYRTIADSLFDDLTRRGVRGQINFRLPHGHFLGLSGGLQKRQTDTQPTYSYGLNYNNSNFLPDNWSINLYAAGFSSPLYKGLTSSLRLGKTFGYNFNADLRYNISHYRITKGNSRTNHAVQLSNYVDVSSKMFFNYWYEYDVGDDLRGNRFWVEIGHRL